nr:MAG: RNA-dependent RNA polymerase [Riboviria sp.]
MLAQYLGPIEKLMWTTTNWNDQPVFAKGRNSYDVAAMFRAGWESFSDPVAYLIDHSKFDSSVRAEHIDWEVQVYTAIYPDDELRQLLRGQYENRCNSKGGIVYSCKARKMSGEYNTSLGDSVINYGALRDVFGDHAVFIINGDDSGVIIDRSAVRSEYVDPATWAKYGFKSVVEIAEEFEKIEFCQSQPVCVDGCWRMVRSPWRAVGRSSISVRRYQGEAWRKLLAAMSDSELACSDGVPMLQEWARYLGRAAAGASPLPGEISYRARLEKRPIPREPGDSTRLSFATAFDIPIQQQLAFEAWCRDAKAVCLQV